MRSTLIRSAILVACAGGATSCASHELELSLESHVAPSRQEHRLPVPDSIPPTHWRTGAIIGAVVLGGVGMAFAAGFCNSGGGDDENCVGRTLGAGFFAGALGFTIGALIGGLFPKGRTNGS